GNVSRLTVSGGATADVHGSATSTNIGVTFFSSGREQVFAGRTDSNATVRGEQDVYGMAVGASVTSSVVVSGETPRTVFGLQIVESGGATSGTFLFAGSQIIMAGGTDTHATIGGTQTVFGSAVSASIGTPSIAGAQFVGAGGLALGTMVTAAGYMEVDSGGTAIDAIVNVSGGREVVSAGGTDISATVA